MNRIFLFFLLVGISGGRGFSLGWRGTPQPQATAVFDQDYDSHREVEFEGKVLRVDPEPCVALPVSSYHIHVQWKEERVEVHLGPCWYVMDQPFTLRVGDSVQGVGSVASWKSGDLRVLVAREIRRGKEVLRLRTVDGKPLWR